MEGNSQARAGKLGIVAHKEQPFLGLIYSFSDSQSQV